MKKRFKNKVKSNSGATLTIALVIFLVISIVGAIILRSGANSAGRIRKADANYMENEVLIGTCEVIRDYMLDNEFSIKYEIKNDKKIYEENSEKNSEENSEEKFETILTDVYKKQNTAEGSVTIPVADKKTENFYINMEFPKDKDVFRIKVSKKDKKDVFAVLEWNILKRTWTEVDGSNEDNEDKFENRKFTEIKFTNPIITWEVAKGASI